MSEAFNMLMQDEGLKLQLYKCTEGYYTIGIGHMISPDKKVAERVLIQKFGKTTITREQAIMLFKQDYHHAVLSAQSIVRLDTYREMALANMVFQMGLGGVLKFKKMIAALKVENWNEAYKQALDSAWYKQTPNRAKRVAEVLRDGKQAYVKHYS